MSAQKPAVPLKDRFGRIHTALRLSLTQNCNMRCVYCNPSQVNTSCASSPKYIERNEAVFLVKTLAEMGVERVRLTGGEPLLRNDLVEIIQGIKSIDGIKDIALTTNGLGLDKQIASLQNAGLNRINISLDSLNRGEFRNITGLDAFNSVWRGVTSALESGMQVKLNTVLMRGVNDSDISSFASLTRKYPIQVRFIEFMPIGDRGGAFEYISSREVRETIESEFGELKPVLTRERGGPARIYTFPDGQGTIGFISSRSGKHFCGDCNRLRVTAEKKLRTCLFAPTGNGGETDLSDALLQQNAQQLQALFLEALQWKGLKKEEQIGTGTYDKRPMVSIGG